MTEQEWLACADPGPMIEHLRGKTSDRKLRLTGCAFCRSIWPLLPDDLSRGTVELCECAVDGLADDRPLWARWDFSGRRHEHHYPEGTAASEAYAAAHFLAYNMEFEFASWPSPPQYPAAYSADRASAHVVRAVCRASGCSTAQNGLHSDLIRDIFGNPFRPAAADPSWLTPTVVGLAEAIYADRAFDRLPVLADALEEAGCDHPDVLAHCRGDGPHVRGCWVVDMLLGKT